MSTDSPSVDTPERREDLDAIIDRLDALEAENERLRDRVQDLEDELEERAALKWEGPNPADVEIVANETGNSVFPFQAITDKARVEDVEELRERVTDVEEGRAEVVVRSESDPDALPVESRIARQQAGDDGMSANEERAAIVFPTFGGRASTVGGSALVMSSEDVRHVLRERTDREDWPDETIRRVMRWTAKLTARGDGDADPRDESNLVTLTKRNGRLALQADREEWIEWSEDASQRLAGQQEGP